MSDFVKWLSLILALIVLAFSLSCSSTTRRHGYVYHRLTSNPTTLDPALIVDVTGGSISAKLFNGLVKLDKELNVVPDLAEQWEVLGNGTSYVFHLRKGFLFSNSREVEANDFKYSFERLLNKATRSPNTWVLDKIRGAKAYMEGRAAEVSGIQVLDRHTLKISLEYPFSPFLSLLTMTAAYVVPREEVERWGPDFSTHPSGSGPFVLEEWNHNGMLVLARNARYGSGGAGVEGVVYRIIPEDLTAVTEFELGNLDVIGIPASEFRRYRDSATWAPRISSVAGLNTYYLGFNCSRPPFNNQRLRNAVSLAIDREKILRTFYEGRGRLASGPVPDLLRKWDAPQEHTFHPDIARVMVEQEGMKGRVVRFYVTPDQEVVDIAEIIQSYLAAAGLQVRIVQLEWSAYKAAINKGEADLFWIGWWADYADPENFLFPLFHSSNHGASGNRTRYTNRDVDRLIEAGQKAVDPAERNRFYARAEQIITRESPWVFFWHRTDYVLTSPRIRNYRIPPVYSMDKGIEVTF